MREKKLLIILFIFLAVIILVFVTKIFISDDDSENETTIIADPENSVTQEKNTEENAETGQTTTEGQQTTTEEQQTTTEEQQTTTGNQQTTNFELDDIYSISNEKVTWGVGVNTYDDGRPVAPVELQNKYGSTYAVDFIKEDEKVIYLTFDEGYENGYTGAILDTLKEKNVKAVFFVTMPYVKSEPDLVRRMIDEGHIVGSHSVTHPSDGMPSLSVEQQIAEYQELHQYVLENFNYEMWLFRPPTGAFSEQSLAITQMCGYRSVMWSFAYKDWVTDAQPDVTEALNNAVNKLHNGAIYLLHAVSSTNTAMLGDFIDQACAKGYTFKEYR